MLKRKSIVLFGDSLTQFSFKQDSWGSNLLDYVTPAYDVYCRGFSGYTTRSAVVLLPKVFHNEFTSPSVVTIFWGANDSSRAKCVPPQAKLTLRQHVPLEEFTAHLKTMVSFFQNNEDSVARGNGVNHLGANSFPSEDRINDVTKEYAKAVISVAQEMGTKHIDLFNSMLECEKWKEFFTDGLHLSSSGNEFVWKKLKTVIDELGPLEFDFPHWSKLNHEDPHSTLDGYF